MAVRIFHEMRVCQSSNGKVVGSLGRPATLKCLRRRHEDYRWKSVARKSQIADTITLLIFSYSHSLPILQEDQTLTI